MAPATEVAFLPLKEGQFPDDPSSALGQKFRRVCQTIVSQPGCISLHWGRGIENPSMLNLFIDWDTVEDHKKFVASPAYKPFLDEFLSMLDGAPLLYHTHFDPYPPTAALTDANSIVTEFLTMDFPTDYSAADQAKVESDLKQFGEIVKGSSDDFKAAVGSWAVEELDDPKSSEKRKAYVLLIGWTSVEAHLKYRETQTFKDSIHLLRGAKDLQNVGVFHVAAKPL